MRAIRQKINASVKAKLEKIREAERAGQFVALCRRFNLPTPELEYKFHPRRQWRVDFAWPWDGYEQRVALEVDGGVWTGGKHGRGSGIVKDHEKQNALASAGFLVFRVQPRDLNNLATVRMVGDVLGVKVGQIGTF